MRYARFTKQLDGWHVEFEENDPLTFGDELGPVLFRACCDWFLRRVLRREGLARSIA